MKMINTLNLYSKDINTQSELLKSNKVKKVYQLHKL